MKAISVGIIGAGQLGRMMALAGVPMGLRFEFLDGNADAPASSLGKMHIAELDDTAAIKALAANVDVLTFEVENVPASALEDIAANHTLLPSFDVLKTAQDRLLEKSLFTELGIPTARFIKTDTLEDLRKAVKELGFPCVLKTRRLGYDGRGQQVLRKTEDLDTAWQKFAPQDLIVEQFVDFECELSVIAARNKSGDTKFYPLAENSHLNGILHVSRAPFDNSELAALAHDYVNRLFDHFDYAGVITLELFFDGNNLLANEMAPRVHNSGHWTIEGAKTSQFENHLRAILDLPLGSTEATGHSVMINFLGKMPDQASCLKIPGFHYHDYGKAPRQSRKIGHGTLVCNSAQQCEELLNKFNSLYSPHVIEETA